MFITKHLLALVALAVGAASSCDVCSKRIYPGQCGFFDQEAKGKWDDWSYYTMEYNIFQKSYEQTVSECVSDVCCASNKDDCCEPAAGPIAGLVIALVVVIGGSVFAYYYWKYLQDDKAYGVAVPPGPLGVQFQKGTCTVHAVTPRSPLRGVTKEGETLLAVNGKLVTPTTMLDAIGAADDGTSERELVFRRPINPVFGAGPAFRCVGVPPGPLGLQFQKGTCTVHAVTPRSPLRGVTKEGETLLAVNGRLVTPTTMLDAIGAADDGTSERELVFCRSSKPLFAAGPAFRCVGVPPGPLGLQFHKGSGTVHADNPRLGVKEGETLVSVNGKPVRAATMLDEIKGADDGTSERLLVFRRASSSKFLLAFGETENGPPAMAPIVSKENAV
jgi:S1-C subfamily serine protease